jgi:phage tail-like protein
MTQRVDPVRNFNFLIALVDSGSTLAVAPSDLSAAPQGGFSECSGLDTTLEAEHYAEGGNNKGMLHFPTRVTWTNIRLKRGVTTSDYLWKWYYSFVEGKGKRKDGLIILQNDAHQAVKVWQFIRGIPLRYAGPTMNAMQAQVAIEELEIGHEGLKLLPRSLSVTIEEVGSAVSNVGSAIGGMFS